MTRSANTSVPPDLADLMARYLDRQTANHGAGLAANLDGGEVEAFDAAPVQTVDPRVAWDEALTVVRFLDPTAATRGWQVPPEWSILVAAQEPATALAFAVGNYPQQVRHVRPLLHGADLTTLRPSAGRPVTVAALTAWATRAAEQGQFQNVLTALGALRLARQFDAAETLARLEVPQAWRALWVNEAAALAWHRGHADEAAASWQQQAESVPVLFNRGMAALFLGRSAEARFPLAGAARQLPEAGAWHHLAGLYIALAEMTA